MTLRGYRKNLVVIKNLDGGVIDEAFFLLSDGTDATEAEIVREADRIISRSRELRAIKNVKPRFSLAAFFIGAATAALIAVVVMLLAM